MNHGTVHMYYIEIFNSNSQYMLKYRYNIGTKYTIYNTTFSLLNWLIEH